MFEYTELRLVVSFCFEHFFLLLCLVVSSVSLSCRACVTNFLMFCLARILEYYRMDFEGPCVWYLSYRAILGPVPLQPWSHKATAS